MTTQKKQTLEFTLPGAPPPPASATVAPLPSPLPVSSCSVATFSHPIQKVVSIKDHKHLSG
eukprot:11952610-Karenia_brevis.AAC.1